MPQCKTCHEELSKVDQAKNVRYCQICRDDFGYLGRAPGISKRSGETQGRRARSANMLGGLPH